MNYSTNHGPQNWTIQIHDSMVPRFTPEKALDLFVMILRFSYLPIPNARGISTTAWSHQSLTGQQCTGSNIRKTLPKKLWRREDKPPRNLTLRLLSVSFWKLCWWLWNNFRQCSILMVFMSFSKTLVWILKKVYRKRSYPVYIRRWRTF